MAVVPEIDPNTELAIERLVDFCIILFVAITTNRVYIEKSIRDINSIKARSENHEERLRLAAVKGGVNWVGPFVLLILVFVSLSLLRY